MMIRWIVFLFVLGAVTDEIAFGQEVTHQEIDLSNTAKLSTR